MTELISEQLSHDGSYRLTQLLKNANDRLKKDGKHGKTCQLKQKGNSVTLQFNFQRQENKGCGCKFTVNGIERAEQIARLVTSQLMASNFSWDWYNRLIGKKEKTVIPVPKYCKDLIDDYKEHWLRENKNLKNPYKSWYSNYRHIELICQEENSSLNSSIINKIIDLTEKDSSTRTRTINALLNFLDYYEIKIFDDAIQKVKKKNKPKKKRKDVPEDCEIEWIYFHGFAIKPHTKKDYYYRFPQWQFLYGILAIYGLRVHEAWNIANWDKPVKIQKGDWIAVDDLEDSDREIDLENQNNDFIVPAILDPKNTDKILCIKHTTKTGYRMAFPLFPQGKDWIKDFNLIQPFNLPDIPNPLEYDSTKRRSSFNCTSSTNHWFNRYDFSPHALRHAYNHRGHSLGINPTFLAQSLGHSLEVNNSTYLDTMPDSRKLKNFRGAMSEQIKKQNRLEELEIENIQLKAKVELLEAKLALIQQQRSGNL